MIWSNFVPDRISTLYEVRDYRHAAAILANEFPVEFGEICGALNQFRFSRDDILKPGGNESSIPKKVSAILRPLGWVEKQLQAKMVADDVEVHQDTHKVDYLTPISQMNSLIDALRWRLCYKNQYVEELMEWLAWHTRWVNRNGTDFGSILTAA
jgi:hypothetical protein